MDRYHRQILLPQIGSTGQEKLSRARVLLIGCGALGTVIADQLARAGVGFLRIVDRDVVELTNLQRQVLFDETDAAESLPKAIAAARKLGRVNSSIQIDPHVADVDSRNVESLVEDVDLMMDGTDNAATRYLINDVAVRHKLPWIYGACVGTEGRTMTIVPVTTACLRCIFPDPPAPGELATCDTVGVLGPAAAMIASAQVGSAIKLLTGNVAALRQELLTMDLWTGRFHAIDLSAGRRADCPTCAMSRFEFLESKTRDAVELCGRNAVQIRTTVRATADQATMEAKLRPFGQITRTEFFVRCALSEHAPITLTVFADGRTIVHGTSETSRAKALHARYVGS